MALTGNVSRWFNRKGYGFIRVMNSDSEHVGNDLFVHLSGINVAQDGYKCLYPGEYVSFDLGSGNDGRSNCVNVTGILGGLLLCEHAEYRFKYFQKDPRSNDENGRGTQRPSTTAQADETQADDVVETQAEDVVETQTEDQVSDNDENDPCQHS